MSAGQRCAVVGVGESAIGKQPGRTPLDLALEAAVNAIIDAGGKDAIDGVIACQPRGEPQSNYSALLANRLGIQPRYINGLLSQAHLGGMLHINEGVTQLRHGAGARQVQNAKVAVVSGQCGEGGIHVTLLFGSALTA